MIFEYFKTDIFYKKCMDLSDFIEETINYDLDYKYDYIGFKVLEICNI